MWDTACQLQADMFREAAAIGGLDVQLVYYRGLAECRASPWVSQAERLAASDVAASIAAAATPRSARSSPMRGARSENRKVQALVFVGDAMEEKLDDLCHAAGELGLLGVPAFMFQEGDDAIAEQAFREIARLTRGAYCRFDPGAAHELGELLRAAAAYAAGGMRALADLSARRDAGAIKLIEQMRSAMDAFIFGVVVLALVLWALHGFTKANPAHAGDRAEGRRRDSARSRWRASSACAAASTSPCRSGSPASGLLGWLPWSMAELRRAHAEKPGPDIAGALGLRRDGARSRHRRDARAHPGRPARGRHARRARRRDADRAFCPRSTRKAARY